MATIKISCRGAAAYATLEGQLTEKAVGIRMETDCDAEWNGLGKTGYVKAGSIERRVTLDGNGCGVVPWECMVAGQRLMVGLEGVSADGQRRIPTVWAEAGKVRPSVAGGNASDADPEPTPGQVELITGIAQQASEEAAEAKRAAAAVMQVAETIKPMHDAVKQNADLVAETAAAVEADRIAADKAAETARTERERAEAAAMLATERPMEKVMLYYGYPVAIGGWDVDQSVQIYKGYDIVILGDTYQQPSQEVYAETVQIIAKLAEAAPRTRVVGYVPIGVTNVGEDSNLPMDELKNRVMQWKAIGAKGIFLDEFGYDYGVTRARQNEIVEYCHDNGMFVFANSWSTGYCFSDDDMVLDWMDANGNDIATPAGTAQTTGFRPNPGRMRAVLNSRDYYLYEHLFHNVSYDWQTDQITAIESASVWRLEDILTYYYTEKIDGMSYYQKFGTQVCSLDAIPSTASPEMRKYMLTISTIGASILNIRAIAFGDEHWGSSGYYKDWDFPPLDIAHRGMNAVTKGMKEYVDSDGIRQSFVNRWSAIINGTEYGIVYDIDNPDDVAYDENKRYVTVNGTRVDNAWLTVHDFKGKIDQLDDIAGRVDAEMAQMQNQIDAAMPTVNQAETAINNALNEVNVRFQEMKAQLDGAVNDVEMLSEGFQYQEREW